LDLLVKRTDAPADTRAGAFYAGDYQVSSRCLRLILVSIPPVLVTEAYAWDATIFSHVLNNREVAFTMANAIVLFIAAPN